ncbi:MAG: hypothetical protein PHC29_08630 [Candidatus Omnitrophica bacterium]|nr:hypothetical protein [Candidatus Omnitrophota bacterium]
MEVSKFIEAVKVRLEDINKSEPPVFTANNTTPEAFILWFLDLIRKRNFDGIVSIQVKENRIWEPRTEETKKTFREYLNITEKI